MGWGVIDVTGNRLSHVANGTVRSNNKLSLAERLVELEEGLASVIAEHTPASAAVETAFVSKDAAAALKLGQARAVALLVPARSGLDVAEYAPNKIKKTVTDGGSAGDARMIGKLTGIVDEIGEDWLILDVGGVGYLVSCSGFTLRQVPAKGEPLSLLIDTYVREDQLRLFGFATGDERDWFRLLQSVQGVGARHAMAMLGSIGPSGLADAVALEDKKAVTQAPGVGPKLAARIVTELRDKAPVPDKLAPVLASSDGEVVSGAGSAVRDAVSALVNLGYAHAQAASAVSAAAKQLNENASAEELIREDLSEAQLRPQRLSDFTGQRQARENLSVFIEAAAKRKEALDHVLFAGPPGLGKTTLAQIVARELGVNFRSTSGPVIAKAGDLAALLTNLEERDVLFIDEIHRLNPAVEEILYPAMEDFELDLIIGEGPAARSVKIELAPFTLVGATTRTGLLTTPLRDRFGIPVRLNFYEVDELELIVRRGAGVMGMKITDDGALEIARRARGTPRIAGRLLRRVRDFAAVAEAAEIDAELADKALTRLEVDRLGLDGLDHRYLSTIAHKFSGGPVGIETIAAALSEPRDAIEEIVEPYLIQNGLVQRTPRGRVLTPSAFQHLGLPTPSGAPGQGKIVDGVHRLPIRVYYEDTDFSGIVYHANYLKFAERSRSDFLRLVGIHHSEILELDPPLAFAIQKMEIEFLAPARIDDLLQVESRYITARGARLEIEQVITREGEPIWRAIVKAACIDTDGRPRRLTPEMLAALGPHVAAASQSG
eukprot:s1_g63.t1